MVAVGLGLPLHRRCAVRVQLQPHHLGLAADPQVQTGLPLEVPVDPPQVAPAVRRQVGPAVDLFLLPAEQRAEDARGPLVPRKHFEGLGLGDAHQLTRLWPIADVIPLAVDEQVGRRAVDELKARARDPIPVRGRDALAHDAPGDGHELVVHVFDALGVDARTHLADGGVAPRCADQPFQIRGQLTYPPPCPVRPLSARQRACRRRLHRSASLPNRSRDACAAGGGHRPGML